MTYSSKANARLGKITRILLYIVLPGLCWYLSNGLHGDYWYLLWLAPVPILILTFKEPPKQIFLIAFLSFLIGRLSWFSYLVSVATLIPAIVFTLALPAIFAVIVLLTKRMISKTSCLYAVFIFPVLYTAFEWLMIKFSPDGSATSLAYSQSDFLPLIQVASVTGILGITFFVTFIPSSLAMAWQFRREKEKLWPLVISTSILVITTFIFGYWRINNIPPSNKVSVGLAVLEEKAHKMGKPLPGEEIEQARNYAEEIRKLAAGGARIVVLPERALNISRETDPIITTILCNSAREHQLTIVTGYTNFRNETKYNSAYVIDEEGKVKLDYNKIYLVNTLEDEFTPGKKPGLFLYGNNQSGVAVCKDLDFPGYIKKYGEAGPAFLCIPAWDFAVDDWLHSRMAILRGVENGFSEIRTARLGRLSISDPYGKINTEVRSQDGQAISLLGQVGIYKMDTLYSKYGDWFGALIFTLSIILIVNSFVQFHRK